jgi:hypothetical protein
VTSYCHYVGNVCTALLHQAEACLGKKVSENSMQLTYSIHTECLAEAESMQLSRQMFRQIMGVGMLKLDRFVVYANEGGIDAVDACARHQADK